MRLNVTKLQTPNLHKQVKTPEPGNSLNSLRSGLNTSKSILKVKKEIYKMNWISTYLLFRQSLNTSFKTGVIHHLTSCEKKDTLMEKNS